MSITKDIWSLFLRHDRRFVFVFLTLASFALSPTARAVDPPPDGGYPNQNTAEGDGALQSLTSGLGKTAIGFDALFSNTNGNDNTANGVNALIRNTRGSNNTADGFNALASSTTGDGNTANGFQTLFSNTTGNGNTATGDKLFVGAGLGGGVANYWGATADISDSSLTHNRAVGGERNSVSGGPAPACLGADPTGRGTSLVEIEARALSARGGAAAFKSQAHLNNDNSAWKERRLQVSRSNATVGRGCAGEAGISATWWGLCCYCWLWLSLRIYSSRVCRHKPVRPRRRL